jgi:hypothetical protein
MAHENQSIFELVERFMSDQRVILRAVVMNAIEKAIQNGMSPEDVNDAIRPLLAYPRSEGEQPQSVIKSRNTSSS